MAQAYETIDRWFQSKGSNQVQSQFFSYLEERVSIIWYAPDSSENLIDIFTRLNIGKIPLTNSELVKALFLSKNSESRTGLKQSDIAGILRRNSINTSNIGYYLQAIDEENTYYPQRKNESIYIVAEDTIKYLDKKK